MNESSGISFVNERKRPLASLIVFWWGVLLVMQQSHRLVLLHDTLAVEPTGPSTLAMTLLTGFRGDLAMASLGILLGAVVAFVVWTLVRLLSMVLRVRPLEALYARCLSVTAGLLAAFFLVFLLIDMGYYAHNKQHPDLVFFEYLEDLFSRSPQSSPLTGTLVSQSQARTQMEAELSVAGKWGPRVAVFILLQTAALLAWAWTFRHVIGPRLECRARVRDRRMVAGTFAVVLLGFSGFHPMGPWAIARANISDSSYYLLAQNPLWYTGDVLYGAFSTRLGGATARASRMMDLQEAIDVTRRIVEPGGGFLSPEYPLVRNGRRGSALSLNQPPNVLLFFIEGLDRRFLGKSVRMDQPKRSRASTDSDVAELYSRGLSRLLPSESPDAVRLTPFLDRLAKDSLYFENFFSPGDKTHHGIFTTLCSFYSGYGRSPIKSRHTYEYLCLPSLLKRAGYETEMVIGYNRDYHQDHTALFLGRNGVQQFFDESRFPSAAERFALGVSDGAVFSFIIDRIRTLQSGARPFFLTTMTLNTHHPYEVPEEVPDVKALRADPDPYLAPLRYVDGELERLFATLQREGLLRNTVVLILGDHGRHERVGQGGGHQFIGHHTTPLFLWLDPSIRTPDSFRPRTIATVASQVDIVPTLLGLAGLSPKRSAFVGRDLSCLLAGDCAADNIALICGVERIALADRQGILMYSISQDRLLVGDLALQNPPVERPSDDSDIAPRLRSMKALLVTAHFMLEKNRIWSWKQFEKDL